jgi:DNA-binding response OmpR family regulator
MINRAFIRMTDMSVMGRIIIADDDALVVEMARSALEARGHLVGALQDGLRVKAVVEAKRPDLLILDCAMPGMSGVDALRQVRNSDRVYDTPVLMLTGRSSSADERIAFGAGADDYMRKPFCPDQLVACVEFLLAKSGADSVQSRAGVGAAREIRRKL